MLNINDNCIRTLAAVVVIVTSFGFPLNVDGSIQTWPSQPIFQANYLRENSTATQPWSFYVRAPSLPTIPDKPKSVVRGGGLFVRYASAPARARVVHVVAVKRTGSGQCVAYARSQGFKIYGNANKWPILAKNAGYDVDLTPEIGAIIATRESSAGTNTGHITGPIKVIDGNWAYISEQNYVRGRVTEGWIDLTSPVIVAFIHPL